MLVLSACNPDMAPPATTLDSSTQSAASDALTIRVARADFQIAYQLEGATTSSLSVPLTPPNGTAWSAHAPVGSPVAAGGWVGDVVTDPDFRAALAISASANRIDAGRLAVLDKHAPTIVAPIAGTVAVSPQGDVSITSSGIDVVVPLSGVQELRLAAIPINATVGVETAAGQRTFPCSFLWIDPERSGADGSGTAELHCRLPRIAETSAGLRASLSVNSPLIRDALVVPEAVLGNNEDGYTVTLMQNGTPSVVPVDVGPGNGVLRVIESDLPVGAIVIPPKS